MANHKQDQRSERGAPSQDDQFALTQSDERGERGYSDADTERALDRGTMVTVAESTEMNFDEFFAEALPTPPKVDGYHMCWLSSTSQADPIHKRMNIGYTPVLYQEVPGFITHKDSSGAGLDQVVRCNEMALYKIPMGKYLQIMKHFHHDQPRSSEEAIRSKVEQIQGTVTKNDKELVEAEEGFNSLISRRPARFAAA